MSFRLWMIFYVFAELAAAMAIFGPWGIIAALVVLAFWTHCWKYGYPEIRIGPPLSPSYLSLLSGVLLLPDVTIAVRNIPRPSMQK